VQRVIEYLDPAAGIVWVDICLSNDLSRTQRYWVLHRGTLSGRDVTKESWGTEPQIYITERICRLHENFDPIKRVGEQWAIGGIPYQVWNTTSGIEAVVASSPEVDAPFTLWELSGFKPSTKYLLRLELDMGRATFCNQIGTRDAFHAYGETILLDKIEREDLPAFQESRPDEYARYKEKFDLFKASAHLIPDIYEFLLVSSNNDLGWEASPLSHMLSPQPINDDQIKRTTCWFVNDIAHDSEWTFIGQRFNSFALKATATSASRAALESLS
jgi:hypothetical protein